VPALCRFVVLRRIVASRWAATLCGSLALALGAQSADVQGPRDMLTASIEAALVEEGLVGATWALVTPEGTTIGAAGLNDASRQRAMLPDDRVQVGSVAKTLVATGVLALVTQGRVDLDAPVARYLPEVPIENRWESDAPLRDGLTHPGGTLRLRHRPGERFSYSNTGYLLLGMLIETVTGTRYERWLDA